MKILILLALISLVNASIPLVKLEESNSIGFKVKNITTCSNLEDCLNIAKELWLNDDNLFLGLARPENYKDMCSHNDVVKSISTVATYSLYYDPNFRSYNINPGNPALVCDLMTCSPTICYLWVISDIVGLIVL